MLKHQLFWCIFDPFTSSIKTKWDVVYLMNFLISCCGCWFLLIMCVKCLQVLINRLLFIYNNFFSSSIDICMDWLQLHQTWGFVCSCSNKTCKFGTWYIYCTSIFSLYCHLSHHLCNCFWVKLTRSGSHTDDYTHKEKVILTKLSGEKIEIK